jgi:hypothetical protein
VLVSPAADADDATPAAHPPLSLDEAIVNSPPSARSASSASSASSPSAASRIVFLAVFLVVSKKPCGLDRLTLLTSNRRHMG